MKILKFSLLVVFLISIPHESLAHTKSVSYSTLSIENELIIINFSVSSREITKLDEYQIHYPNLNKTLSSHLKNEIFFKGIKVEPSIQIQNTKAGITGLSLRYKINQSIPIHLSMNAFFREIPGHIHYTKINYPSGEKRVMVLNRNNHELVFFEENSIKIEQGLIMSFIQYLELGFIHILEGLDHLVFLLALLLLCKSLRSLIFAATGFTIGHSVTLALAASNIIIPQINIIESLIGWTIILASIESLKIPINEFRKIQTGIAFIIIILMLTSINNSAGLNGGFVLGLGILTLTILRLSENKSESEKFRPILAIIFGTIHGFGFANILNEISLDQTNFLVSLLGFNFGVEIGQILVLILMWLTIRFINRSTINQKVANITPVISSILCSIGLYWFLTRLFE